MIHVKACVGHGPAYHTSPRFSFTWHHAYLLTCYSILYCTKWIDWILCSILLSYFSTTLLHKRQIQVSWFMIHGKTRAYQAISYTQYSHRNTQYRIWLPPYQASFVWCLLLPSPNIWPNTQPSSNYYSPTNCSSSTLGRWVAHQQGFRGYQYCCWETIW